MMDITINKIPSYSIAQRIARENPTLLSDKVLVNTYAKACAIHYANHQNRLPQGYFNGVIDSGGVTGRVPRDMWLQSNMAWSVGELKKEIERRNLNNAFTIWIETH